MFKLKPAIITLIVMSFLLSSATTSKASFMIMPVMTVNAIADPVKATVVQQKRGSFLQRMLYKLMPQKYRNISADKANQRAKSSFGFGLAAVGSLLVGIAVPFVFLLAVPFGIVALVQGSSALNNGTTVASKARWGKGLGLGALIAFAAFTVLVVVAFSAAYGG